jgi:hypothetical protein
MMAEGFTKLFGSLIHSSVWQENLETKVVWVTMLAMADQHGYVGASVLGLAHAAGVPVEAAERALAKFLAPDPYSRSQEHEGRRIEVADRGWVLLNYSAFRAERSAEKRREWDRERKRKEREARKARDGKGRPQASASVHPVRVDSAQAEAEAEAEAEVKQVRRSTEPSEAFETAWDRYPKRPNNSKAAAWRAWSARVAAGEDEGTLGKGVERYAAYVDTWSVEPRFVKMASTFFGPDQHYLNDYTVPEPDHLSDRERRSKAAIAAFAQEGT